LKELGLAAETVNQKPMGEAAPDFVQATDGKAIPWGPDPSQARFVQETMGKLTPGQWGFFFDGDGDRLVIVEKTAAAEPEIISPNDLSLIFAHYLLEKGLHGTEGRAALVRTAPTTRWLDRLARAQGLAVVDTPVGSKHFGTEMDTLVVAAEESGHVFFRLNGEVFADSAMAEALLAVRVLAEQGSLGAYLQKIKAEIKAHEAKNGIEPVDLAYSRTKFTAGNDADAANILTMKDVGNEGSFRAALAAALATEPLLAGKAIRDIVRASAKGAALDKDGLLVEFTDGTWMMWRKSGTEPAFRIYAEQNTPETAAAMDRAMSRVMTQAAQGPLAPATPTQGIPEGVLQRGSAYRDGNLKTDPVRQPFRPSVEADVPLIAAMNMEDRTRYMRAAVATLLDGSVNFSVLAAGAASRMNAKEAPPEALAMIDKMYGGQKSDIHSKAAVPVAEVDGRVYTFLGTFLTDVARLESELESVNGGRLPGNSVSVLTNDEYRPELDGELELMGRYGVRGEIHTPHQSLGDQYIGTVADTQKLKDKLGDKFDAALAAARAAEGRVAAGDRTAVVLPNEKTPLGHGEFFHQMVASGDLLRHIDRGVRAIYVRNIDNAPATLDTDWLVMLGMFIENDLDFQAEVSPRAPGMKGGALIRTEQGQLVLTEGPSFQASWDKLVADRKSDGWTSLGKEDAVARAAALIERDGRIALASTPMDIEGGALADRAGALAKINDGSVVAFERNGAVEFARRIVPESTYWFNNAAGFFRPQYLYFMYRRDANQTYEDFIAEMRAANADGLAAIADRGRSRFPTLIDPKPAKGQPAVAVKIETNMWQGTQVAADAGAKLAAAGVFSIQNILSIGADSRGAALPHLRFLATKQWTGPAESYESNKPYIGTILARAISGRTISSDLLSPEGRFARPHRGFATVGQLVVLAVLTAGLLFAPAAFAAGTEAVAAVRDIAPWLWGGLGLAALGFFAFTARGRRAADTLLRAFDYAPVWVKMLIIATVFYIGTKTVDAALASIGVVGALAGIRRGGPTVYETVGSKPNWDAMVPPVVDPLASLRASGDELAFRAVGANRLNALGTSFAAPVNNRGDFEPLFRDPEAKNADRGGWVNRPWELNDDPAYLDSIEAEAAAVRGRFDRMVVVGMGGESSIVGPDQTADGKTLTVVANTSPEKLQRAVYSLTEAELRRTVFYVISKSGGTSETLANLDLITGLLRSRNIDPKQQIVYVTDPGTSLAQRGEKEGVPVRSREYKENTNTGGRNTLVNFPTLLALAFLRPGAAKAQVAAIVQNHARTPTAADPWVQAANRLTAAMQTGVTKMAALEPESLRAQVGVWQQQNVEESLGKDGKGLTVYTQVPPLDVLTRSANRDWVFVELQIAGRENETAPIAQAYREAGFEVVTVPVPAGEAAPVAASYGWMKMVAFLGALNDINFSNQPAVESYKSIMKAGNLSLEATERKAWGALAMATGGGLTVSFDGLMPFLAEAQRQRVGRLLREGKTPPAEILGRVLADVRGRNPSLRDVTLSYYEDADAQTAEFLNDLAARYQQTTGDAVKWGEGTGVLHGLFVNWFGGPLHQIPVHVVTRDKGGFYTKGSALLQEGAVAAHEALVKAGRPSVLVVLDADLDASGRRAVGRFFGDVADAVVVADGALAAGARDTMDDLGETPTNAATAARYADGVVSGLLASQLALRANARHERMADTVLDVAGSFATALFGADVAAKVQDNNRAIANGVKTAAQSAPVAIGGVEAGRAVTRYLDATSSREALRDALNTTRRHLAGENSVALARPGTGLLVVLESELRDGENADLVREIESLGAQHPRVKVQLGEGNDVLGRNEKGERVLRVAAAVKLLNVRPVSIDVILPPATSTLVEKSGYEAIVRVLRWILGGVAVEVTSGVEAGIQALVATLKSA
jgi:glucose-6-phosphate isomerase